ncbi:MAG: hypothetical protein K2Y37_13720 [Pirellulales bacterium]|nr:hypothetical protein [Pirellulales bacterium]
MMRAPTVLLVLALLFAIVSPVSAVVVVDTGWDLFETAPPTFFMGIPFQGVPLGTFNFGGSIGVQNVGSTDTIVQRLSPASVPSAPGTAPPIPIELVALHLQSVIPINLGSGLGLHYVTLQSERGGPASSGQMTIDFASSAGGTFSSFFDVFFDLRLGSLSGPIVFSSDLFLQSGGVPWDRTPDGTVVIDDVNHKLNGTNQNNDFWPLTPFTEQHPQGLGVHTVVPPSLPEPTSIVIWSLLGGVLIAARWWRWKASR